MRVVLLRRPAGGEAGRDESLGSMKQKYEGKNLQGLVDLGERIEAGEADLRDIFEESEEPADPDEERGPEANEKLLKKLHDSTRKLKDLRAALEELEEELRERPGPRRKLKLERRYVRMRERVKAAFTTMGLSRHVREAVIAELRHQLEQFRP